MIGPNCLGTHSPAGRLTFRRSRASCVWSCGCFVAKAVGLRSTSCAAGRAGLGFSALVSVGNCADVGINELLDYMLADPNTRVIGLDLENPRRGP